MKRTILFLVLSIQYSMLSSQVSFPNIDCLRNHLEGTWELYKHYWGIQGQSDYYPTADDNYFFEFSKYAPDTFKMVCKKYHNGLVTETDTIRISYQRITGCCWELVNMPGINVGIGKAGFLINEDYQTHDSLCLLALNFDASNLYFTRKDTNSTEESKKSPNAISIIPNPISDNMLNIEIESCEISEFNIMVFDMAGHTVINNQIIKVHEPLNISSLSNGVYILVVEAEFGVRVLNFVKI